MYIKLDEAKVPAKIRTSLPFCSDVVRCAELMERARADRERVMIFAQIIDYCVDRNRSPTEVEIVRAMRTSQEGLKHLFETHPRLRDMWERCRRLVSHKSVRRAKPKWRGVWIGKVSKKSASKQGKKVEVKAQLPVLVKSFEVRERYTTADLKSLRHLVTRSQKVAAIRSAIDALYATNAEIDLDILALRSVRGLPLKVSAMRYFLRHLEEEDRKTAGFPGTENGKILWYKADGTPNRRTGGE